MHITVEPGSGIPSRCTLKILERHLKVIVTRTYCIVDVDIERIITIRPISHLAAVDLHMGIAHGTIKHQSDRALCSVGYIEHRAVHTFANERQTTGTAGFQSLLCFAVLLDSHTLQVVVDIERTVNGPIVRHTHTLPLRGLVGRTLGKLPAIGKCFGSAQLSHNCHNGGNHHHCRYNESSHNCHFYFHGSKRTYWHLPPCNHKTKNWLICFNP